MSELPDGTITLLATHIEGSTALWEHHPAAMPTALDRHAAILQQTIAAHGGAVFYTGGDAVYAAFPTAPAALAALPAQRQLQLEAWGEVGSLRVGMALHTGTAEYLHD